MTLEDDLKLYRLRWFVKGAGMFRRATMAKDNYLATVVDHGPVSYWYITYKNAHVANDYVSSFEVGLIKAAKRLISLLDDAADATAKALIFAPDDTGDR